MHLGRWNYWTGSHSLSWFSSSAYLIFYNCDVSLCSHNCSPIRPVFHQHLNSHITYRGSQPEPSNHTWKQFLHLSSYLLLRSLWLKSDNKVTRKKAFIHLFLWALTDIAYSNTSIAISILVCFTGKWAIFGILVQICSRHFNSNVHLTKTNKFEICI